MALIKCKKCGKSVSNTAMRCVHCNAKLKNKNGWIKFLIIGIVIFFFLIIVALISFLIFVTKYAPYNDNWFNEVAYYEDETYTHLVCTVRNEVEIDDNSEIRFSSRVVRGHCEYDEFDIKGTYEFEDWDKIEADFNYHGTLYKVEIELDSDHMILKDNYNFPEYFYNNKKDMVEVKRVYYDKDKIDKNQITNSPLAKLTEISYLDLISLFDTEEKAIVLLEEGDCVTCENYLNAIYNIQTEYNVTINYLDTDKLNDFEENVIFHLINTNEEEAPILLFFNSGLSDKIVRDITESAIKDKINEIYTNQNMLNL